MESCRVWNPTEETVTTRIHGSWFSFPPNGQKTMDQAKGEFIKQERTGTGLVVLTEQFNPMSDNYKEGFDKTPEGKAIMAELKDQGIRNLIEFHMAIVRNNQVCLRQDLAEKYPSGDPAKLTALNASQGELNSMRLVNKYKGKASDNAQKRVEEVEKLMSGIGPVTS